MTGAEQPSGQRLFWRYLRDQRRLALGALLLAGASQVLARAIERPVAVAVAALQEATRLDNPNCAV